MSDRRGFLGNVLRLCGVAAVAPAVSLAEGPKWFSIDSPDTLRYRGFNLRFTGWKGCFNSDVEVAQWCACEKGFRGRWSEGRLFYVSYPGGEGRYYPGGIFDISFKEGQEVPTWSTSEALKQHYRFLALQRMIALIDKNVAVA